MVATPDAADFAPLPQLISTFGLPDVLQVLPQLKNQLETVDASSTHLTLTSAQLNGLADDLDRQASQVRWQGPAAADFQKRVTEATGSMRQVAASMDTTVTCTSQVQSQTWNTISWICLIIAALIMILDILFAVALAESWITAQTSWVAFILSATGLSATTLEVILGGISGLLWMTQGFIDKINSAVTTCTIPTTPSGA